jgi:hypothetical protein
MNEGTVRLHGIWRLLLPSQREDDDTINQVSPSVKMWPVGKHSWLRLRIRMNGGEEGEERVGRNLKPTSGPKYVSSGKLDECTSLVETGGFRRL